MSVPGTDEYSPGLAGRAAAAFAASVPAQPADDGLFGPGSVTWRLAGSMTAPVVGIRALLLQALHPLAMAGVAQHSAWRTDPGGRLASTSAYEVTVSFGEVAAASAAAARVRKIHSSIRGTDPATGKPYAADDPVLLLWVHNALVDSQLACTRQYAKITPDDADRYVREQVAAAEIIGIPSGLAPASAAALAAYFDAVRPELTCTPAAAEAMSYLLDYLAGPEPGDPAAPPPEEAEMWRDICDAAIAALPDWAIALYADHVPQVPEAIRRFGEISANSRIAVRQALGVLDTVFMAEPGVLEARQRIQLRIRATERA
ncbi:MAG TPA: oxygenase MpaB family protein [Trebonia sp.]